MSTLRLIVVSIVFVVFAGFGMGGAPARAEVKKASADALHVELRLETAATPGDLYRAMGNISHWWNGKHTFSGNARFISLSTDAGGCLCEKWDAGTVEHGRVIESRRGRLVRIDTALGPLIELPVKGVLTFAFDGKDNEKKATIVLTYRVSGDESHKLQSLAPAVDKVLEEQAARLAKFAATGKPE